MPKDAVVEIYTEEIPARFLPPAVRQLKSLADAALQDKKLKYSAVKTFATPRRLTLYIEALEEKSRDETEEFTGPLSCIAFDDKNRPTQAGVGFAKRFGVDSSELKIKEMPKGKYVYIIKKTQGVPAEKILPAMFTEIISKLEFPKTMVWEDTKFRFARPVRGLVCLYGDRPVKLNIAGVKSGTATFGLYVTSQKRIKIPGAKNYFATLRNNNVLVDDELRKQAIVSALKSAAKKMDCNVNVPEGLLTTTNFLVEYPSAVTCRFDERFLKLPPEIIVNCIEKKQNCFSMVDGKGALTNNFIAIRNGISEHQKVVSEGYERVLQARLTDAEFFFRQDTKTKLADKSEKLKGVIFHKKLGTVAEKVGRIVAMCEYLVSVLNIPDNEVEKIRRTALLCKNDLVTGMVYEYTELQGVLGRIYALYDGEDGDVAGGIEQHYWPLTSDGEIPRTLTGTVVSLADKIDTLAGDFSVGIVPTGSEDPYGLRRAGAGLLRIILEKKLDCSLRAGFEKAMGLLPEQVNGQVMNRIFEFLSQRLETIFEEKKYRFDEIRCVLSGGFDNLADTEQKIKSIKEIRSIPDFEPLITGYKRAANILKQAEQKGIKQGIHTADAEMVLKERLSEKEEKALYEMVQELTNEIESLVSGKNYSEILKKLVGLRPAIDLFFEKVMVMTDDSAVRDARLLLLQKTVSLFYILGNFSLLQ
ncbi:MAG: glycine--tRNA ligase subunit beta [Elusimicrobiota bacterium]